MAPPGDTMVAQSAIGASGAIGVTFTQVGTVSFAGKAGVTYHVTYTVVGTGSAVNGTVNTICRDGANPIASMDIGGSHGTTGGWESYTAEGVVACGVTDRTITINVLVANVTAGTFTVNRGNILVTAETGQVGPQGPTGLSGTGVNIPVVGARVWRNTSQAFTINVTATVVMTSTLLETLLAGTSTSFYDAASGGIKIPAGHGGDYILTGHARWDGTAAGANPILAIFVNGLPVVRDAPGSNPAPVFLEQKATTTWRLNAGDVVTLGAFQGSSGRSISSTSPASGTDPVGPTLEVWRISDSVGAGFAFRGVVSTWSALPATGNQVNDTWITQDLQHIWSWNGTTWVDAGAFGSSVTSRVVGRVFGSAAPVALTATSQEIYVLSGLALKAGRTYRASLTCRAMWTNNDWTQYIRLQNGASTSAGVTSSLDAYFKAGSSYGSINWDYIVTVAADGVYTLSVGCLSSLATGSQIWTDGGGYFMVEDLTGIKGDAGTPGPPGGTMSGFMRVSSTNQNAVTGGYTDLTFDVVKDAIGAAWTTTDSKHFVCPTDGVYHLYAGAQGNGVAWTAAQVYIRISVNGVDVAGAYPSGSTFDYPFCGIEMMLHAGDIVGVGLLNVSGATLVVRGTSTPVSGSPYSPVLSIWRAGAGPIGPTGATGATGPVGPDVTLLQSNYWYGSIATPTTALGGDIATNIGWTTIRSNGFTLASSSQRITPTLAGRYRVTAAPSYSNGANASSYCRSYINHYDSTGTLKAQASGVGGGSAAGAYSQAVADGEFDVVAGDYFVIQGAIQSTTGLLLNNSYCTVVPVGGTKGDTGATGPDVTLVQSSYAYLGFTGPVGGGTVLAASVWNQLLLGAAAPPATFLNRFTLQASNQQIAATQAGKYLAQMELSVNTGAAVILMQCRINHYNSVGTLLAQHDLVGSGSAAGTWNSPNHQAIFDMAAGDYLTFYVSPNAAVTFDSRSTVTVTPVGGTKGDTGLVGPTGNPGVAEHAPTWLVVPGNAGWTNYGSGWQSARITRKHGIVKMEGLVVGASGAAASIGTIPVGYRPAATLIFIQLSATGGLRMDIGADGSIGSIAAPIAYVSLVSSWVADPAYGIEYGFDLTAVVTNSTVVTFQMTAGIDWQAGVRNVRAAVVGGTVNISPGQWGVVGTNNVTGNYTTSAAAVAAATAARTNNTPAWIISRTVADAIILTDIREWF